MKLTALFDQIVSVENLYQASLAAARGKRTRESSADFHFHREEEIHRLRVELVARTYRHGPYREFTICDPKKRLVSAAPFRDRVVHHAIHDVIEPLIDKTFIFDSYACRKGKGTHAALDRAQHFLRANRFYLHGDIRKFFQSIDREVLMEIIEKRIQDPDVLDLIRKIVFSFELRRGLPIGNLTSQFFANLYLNELDHFAKHTLGARYYLRYMDDFVLFSRSREQLRLWKRALSEFLHETLELDLHDGKTRIGAVGEGVSFLGFRLFKDYRRLRIDNVQRFRERLRRFDPDSMRRSIESWVSHSRYANAAGLRRTFPTLSLLERAS